MSSRRLHACAAHHNTTAPGQSAEGRHTMAHAPTFPCTGCGLCCRHVGLGALTAWLDRGDGACRHFQESSRSCAIYANRPAVCRVVEGHAEFFPQMPMDEYLARNAQACNALQVQHGLPQAYRVVLWSAAQTTPFVNLKERA